MPQVEVRLKVVPTATALPAAHRAPAGGALHSGRRGAVPGSCAVAALALEALVCTILPGPRANHRGVTTGPAAPGATRVRGSSHVKGSSPPPGSDLRGSVGIGHSYQLWRVPVLALPRPSCVTSGTH